MVAQQYRQAHTQGFYSSMLPWRQYAVSCNLTRLIGALRKEEDSGIYRFKGLPCFLKSFSKVEVALSLMELDLL